jgi:hypothetical protein
MDVSFLCCSFFRSKNRMVTREVYVEPKQSSFSSQEAAADLDAI